jgi:hypothetical protein
MSFLFLICLQQAAPQGPSTTVTFSTIDSYRFPTDLDPGDGDVALTLVKASGDVFHKFGPTDFLRAIGGVDFLHYDWSGVGATMPEDFFVLRMEGTYIHAYDEHWSGIGYASAYFQFEEGADVADGGAYSVAAGALYRFGPEFTLGGLFRVLTRIEDSPYVFIQPYFEWKPSPSWTLRMEQREGFGVEATHLLDDAGEWALQARAVYSERRFRLDDDALRPEGVFEDARFTVVGGVRWQPMPRLSAAVGVGADLWQEFTIQDRGGHQGAEFESAPGPLVGFYFTYTF